MKPLLNTVLYHPHQIGDAEKVGRIVAEGLRAAEALLSIIEPVTTEAAS